MSSEVIALADRHKPNWLTIIVLAIFHIGAVAALFMFSWKALIISLVLYWMTICLGISMGYHRLHTHRSYRVPLALEYFFAVCGTLTLEGGPIFWVGTHRIHHQNPISPATRIRLATAPGGRTSAGSASAKRTTTTRRAMAKYTPDLAKHPFLHLAE